MADVTNKSASGSTKLVGSDESGVETNYTQVDIENGKRRLLTSSTVTPSLVTHYTTQCALNNGSDDMIVNGSNTPVEFLIQPPTDHDLFVDELRFYALDNIIRYGNYFLEGADLTNGISIEIKSNDIITTFPLIKRTQDFIYLWSDSANGVSYFIDDQTKEVMIATRVIGGSLVLKSQGTFATDDYIKVTIQDNLDNTADEFKFICLGHHNE